MDEIEHIKRRGRDARSISLDVVAKAFADAWTGPVYDQTYRQALMLRELRTYQRRRQAYLGIEAESREQIAERVGYRQKAPSLMHRQWNRSALIAEAGRR